MTNTPQETTQLLLDAYMAAELAILNGAQEYTVEGRKVRKGDLPAIQSERRRLQGELLGLQDQSSGGSHLITVVPL